ncbi:T9SS type A sorting domain-containing protein [Rudanella paleaurantiibacter]|uniref:T9SS type A sorting domain-containing protein n=1 Tax=Rudanella paleaurantiibacter TaxID=2614655 RepID=A0A7J5U637_9BACT|nr:T9SS type A sorting domain-containing protein [Rudanella paleaurantiibacter]
MLLGLVGATSAQDELPCGVSDRVLPDSTVRLMGQLPRLMQQQRARMAASERKICRIALEVDSDTYVEFERDTNRIKQFYLNRVEQASRIFEHEINTQLVVVYVRIWKDSDPDPYRGEGNLYTLYSIMNGVWARTPVPVPYDKRVYMPTKSTSGAGGLGGGNQAIAANRTAVATLAHELGHCFDSPHTHHCAWPGGPIDFCSTIESTNGDCYSGSIQNAPGTLMSYCTDTRLTFHPLCQALMTNATDRSLGRITLPSAPALPVSTTLTQTPFLSWTPVPSADRYEIDVATDAAFTQKFRSDTSSLNGYLLGSLPFGTTYFVRVRAINTLGTSAWSVTGQLQRQRAPGLQAPLLLPPPASGFFAGQAAFQAAIQPVDGATAYHVQVTNSSDLLFRSPNTLIISRPTDTYNSLLFGMVRAKVRAVVNNIPGPWSAEGLYAINPPDYYIGLPFQPPQSAPLTLPIAYYSVTGRESRVVLMVATDPSFARLMHRQELQYEQTYSLLLKNLLPNTTYYVRAEEYNTTNPNLPTGLLTQTQRSFQTGAAPLSDRWSFVNSTTHPDWPQGGAYGPLTVGNNSLWYSTSNGLTRISLDSLRLRVYNQNTTNGRLGNSVLAHGADTNGTVWVTNRVSINTFRDGFPVQFNQLGRLNEQTGSLTDRYNFTTNGYNPQYLTHNPLVLSGYNHVGEIKDFSLNSVYTPPFPVTISQLLMRDGSIWMLVYNTSMGQHEVLRLDPVSRGVQTFNSQNTPQLGAIINQITLDQQGHVWVAQATRSAKAPFVLFDGQAWTTPPAGPITSAQFLTSDPSGRLYVLTGSPPYALYRHNSLGWEKLGDELPFNTNLNNMTVDRQGNVWFSGLFGLMRYATCTNVARPELTASQTTILADEKISLTAKGCTNVMWSWTSASDTVTNWSTQGSNALRINLTNTTTFRSRCVEGICSGPEAVLTITVQPQLVLHDVSKPVFCTGDTLALSYRQVGEAGAGNRFNLVLKRAGAASSAYSLTSTLSTQGKLTVASSLLPTTITPGRYVLHLDMTQPQIRSRDSLLIDVADRPSAELSTDKLTFVLGDSTRVSVALTGSPPWRFTRWDNQTVQANQTPYLATLIASQPTNYTLALRNLSDLNCPNGNIRNNLVVSALALSAEPLLNTGVRVFPNPVVGWLTVEADPSVAPFTALQLTDMNGRTVRQRTLAGRSRREQWDLSDLPVGVYLLTLETTDGHRLTWKVLK